MNKKTFFKISATALILGISIALSVKYFPAVALAIKSGVIASAAPLVAFAIFTIIALASAAAFIKYVVSAIRSNNTQGKPNGVSGEPRSQKKEEGQSLVQEEVAPTPTPSLLPHVTEELTGTVLQQPDNNLTKDMETPQPEKDDAASAICNKSKPSNADERSQNENPDKERSLVNEEKQAVTASASPLIPHVTEKLTGAVLQRQPVDNSVKGTETMQPGKDGGVVVNGDSAEQQTIPKSLNSLLPEYPPTSPLNSMTHSQPLPAPPSSTHGKSLGNEQHQGNWSKSLSRSTSRNSFCSSNDNSKYPLPTYPEPSSTHSLVDSESLPSLPICVQLNAALAEYERQRPNQTNSEEEVQEYKSLPISSAMPCPSNLRRSRSLYSLTEDVAHMDMIRDDFDSSSTLPSSMTDSSMSLSLHQHTLYFGMPPITEDEESTNTYLRQPRVNQRVQLDEDYPGFAITSNGARLY